MPSQDNDGATPPAAQHSRSSYHLLRDLHRPLHRRRVLRRAPDLPLPYAQNRSGSDTPGHRTVKVSVPYAFGSYRVRFDGGPTRTGPRAWPGLSRELHSTLYVERARELGIVSSNRSPV